MSPACGSDNRFFTHGYGVSLTQVNGYMFYCLPVCRYGFDWESFTVHDHYIWNSARPRTEQRTVEMRPACQQPWDEHMVVSALCLGLVEASPTILQVSSDLSIVMLLWGWCFEVIWLTDLRASAAPVL